MLLFLWTPYAPDIARFWNNGVRMNSFTAQFSNFREIPIANKREIYVMIENKNAETAVEWAKCFLCQKDTAKTFLSSYKISAIFTKLANFAATDEAPSHRFWIKSIKKKGLEPTIKNYHLKHHNSCTANHGSNMLVQAQKKSRKIQEKEKDKDSLSFSPPIIKRQSNVSVMGELVCCFCHEIDIYWNQLMCCWILLH